MSNSEIDIASKSCREWSVLIDDWIYSERDRAILKDRMLNGLTFEKLAEKHELSDRQVKRIVQKSVNALIRHI